MTSSHSSADLSSLDQLTGGAFGAATSGERATRLRDWLATSPELEPLQEVYREMAVRDKGAAKVLKDRLDELKRAREQELLAAQWLERATGIQPLGAPPPATGLPGGESATPGAPAPPKGMAPAPRPKKQEPPPGPGQMPKQPGMPINPATGAVAQDPGGPEL